MLSSLICHLTDKPTALLLDVALAAYLHRLGHVTYELISHKFIGDVTQPTNLRGQGGRGTVRISSSVMCITNEPRRVWKLTPFSSFPPFPFSLSRFYFGHRHLPLCRCNFAARCMALLEEGPRSTTGSALDSATNRHSAAAAPASPT
jgi:hypothetical protein